MANRIVHGAHLWGRFRCWYDPSKDRYVWRLEVFPATSACVFLQENRSGGGTRISPGQTPSPLLAAPRVLSLSVDIQPPSSAQVSFLTNPHPAPPHDPARFISPPRPQSGRLGFYEVITSLCTTLRSASPSSAHKHDSQPGMPYHLRSHLRRSISKRPKNRYNRAHPPRLPPPPHFRDWDTELRLIIQAALSPVTISHFSLLLAKSVSLEHGNLSSSS